MLRTNLAERLSRVLGVLTPATRRRSCRTGQRRTPWVEPLEGRALMANITASAVISSAPDGADFDYAITLTNSSSSTSPVGTFWYAWNTTASNPNINYLATSPASVTPPSGWSDQVTNTGPTDGFGIMYTANRAASYLAPGASLTFKFTSTDPPSSVNGNSPFYPGVPVDTSFVYPQGPFSDAGHEFVVTPTTSPTPTPTPSPTPTATAPITITGVRVVENKKHLVTEIVVNFSGGLNASGADSLGSYQLTVAGKKNSFTGKGAKAVLLSAAAYVNAAHEVTLTPRKAFAVSKPVQLIIHGQPPGGLQDSSGQFIDGGSNGEFVISRKGVARE